MAHIIPNENTWIGFATAAPADPSAPTAAEIGAATDLTGFVSQITATSQGNSIPTPTLDTLFETSVPGTSQAQFSGDFYRDDAADTAWTSLPRGTLGWFYISRFGGTGTNSAPAAGDIVEVWPIQVTSRAAAPLSSNTPQTFTLTAAVVAEPDEDAVVSV